MSTKRVFQLFLVLLIVLVSLAATPRAHAWSACGGSYVVQPGDWLAKIARYCGVTLADLRAANPGTYYRHFIYPGEVLTIPSGDPGGGYTPAPSGYACGPAADGYGSYYVVCRGDTLANIAAYYGVSWHYLQQRNGIWNANIIFVGQVIRL